MAINTTLEHPNPENITGAVDFIKYVNTESNSLLIGILLLAMFTILFMAFQRNDKDPVNNALGALFITTLTATLLLATGLIALNMVIILILVTGVAAAARGFHKYRKM